MKKYTEFEHGLRAWLLDCGLSNLVSLFILCITIWGSVFNFCFVCFCSDEDLPKAADLSKYEVAAKKEMEHFNKKALKWAHKIAGEQGFQAGYKVDVQRVSGTGYSSITFRVTISEPNRELKMFAKVASITEELRKTSYTRLFYDELYFYTHIAPIFREFEIRHLVGEQYRLSVPKFYGGELIPREEIIVLEDLCHKGFVSPDPRKHFDWEFAGEAVDHLARFHALSFVYGVVFPEEFNKILESKRPHVFDSKVMRRLGFEETLPVALAAIGEGELQQKVKRYLASADRYAEFVHLYQAVVPRVLAHGDYKINNLMQYDGIDPDGDPGLKVVPIDFQNIHAGNPATDLLYLVMLGSDQDFRLEHLDSLRDHYHIKLTNSLTRMGVSVGDVYDECTFKEDWNAALPIGLMVALMILPMILAPKETAETVRADSELGKRLRGIVRDYIYWGIIE